MVPARTALCKLCRRDGSRARLTCSSRRDSGDSSVGNTYSQKCVNSMRQLFKSAFASLHGHPKPLPHKARKKRFSGWRMGVFFGCCMSLFVLCCNIALLVIGTTKTSGYNDSESGIVTLLYGDETAITRYNIGFHILINFFSSALLAGSNYTMQVISSPTREEIDKAHRQQDWLSIGLLSPRNWKRIARKRALLCLILGLSSVPLHLL